VSNAYNKEVSVETKDTVLWCNEQLEKAIAAGKNQEAEAYERLKFMWEERSASKKSTNE